VNFGERHAAVRIPPPPSSSFWPRRKTGRRGKSPTRQRSPSSA